MIPACVDGILGIAVVIGLLAQTVLRPASSAGLREAADPAAGQWLVWLWSPQLWAVLATAVGLWYLLPRRGQRWRRLGVLLTATGLAIFVQQLRGGADVSANALFWALAAVTIVSAVAAISSQNPVYCAIWFALTLLGTAALFLLHGAQFLSVATVVVYAGAIVVTFLFVVMLAQSDGHAHYDRISWGWVTTGMATLAGAGLLAVILPAIGDLSAIDRQPLREQVSAVVRPFVGGAGEGTESGTVVDDESPVVRSVRIVRQPRSSRHTLYLTLADRDIHTSLLEATSSVELAEQLKAQLPQLAGVELDVELTSHDVLDSQHMANLGGQLFARHLISIEVAGALLLVALVGAVAIVIQGRPTNRLQEPGKVSSHG